MRLKFRILGYGKIDSERVGKLRRNNAIFSKLNAFFFDITHIENHFVEVV